MAFWRRRNHKKAILILKNLTLIPVDKILRDGAVMFKLPQFGNFTINKIFGVRQ